MMKACSIILVCLLPLISLGQNARLLHYTETSGFDHNTRANSLAMFQSFPNLEVVSDNSGAGFDTLSSLLNFDVIVFSNTSGSNLLDSIQRSHFEQYMLAGGNLIGIHAASDTYRHSTANGGNTGAWDFYAESLGGSVQTNPNHVSGTPRYDIRQINPHPSIFGFPSTWSKNEEYYYWENGFLDNNIQVILEVEETTGPNNQVNSYDSARAVSWYKVSAAGSKIFYTSLGHANSNFTSDTLFQKHIWQATQWCVSQNPASSQHEIDSHNLVQVYPNPASDDVLIQFDNHTPLPPSFYIKNAQGQLEKIVENIDFNEVRVNTRGLASGVYFIEIIFRDNRRLVKKLVIR